MNWHELGEGCLSSPENSVSGLFFIPLSPPPLHTLYLKWGGLGQSTLNHRFIAVSSFWKLSLEKGVRFIALVGLIKGEGGLLACSLVPSLLHEAGAASSRAVALFSPLYFERKVCD